MPLYMLDTNAVNSALKLHPAFMQHLQSVPAGALCISAITRAEIAYGLANKPQAVKLHRTVGEFLLRVQTLPFTEQEAAHYGQFRAKIQAEGRNLSPPDMLIAAHADSMGAVLVSNDAAFRRITGLAVEDWTQEE